MLYGPKAGDESYALYTMFETYAKELGRTATYFHAGCPATDIFIKTRAGMARDRLIGAELLRNPAYAESQIAMRECMHVGMR